MTAVTAWNRVWNLGITGGEFRACAQYWFLWHPHKTTYTPKVTKTARKLGGSNRYNRITSGEHPLGTPKPCVCEGAFNSIRRAAKRRAARLGCGEW